MTNLLLTSFAKKSDALKFAKKLVTERLAACCTLLPGATSIYTWKGKQQSASEVLLLIKTLPAKLPLLKKFFKAHHPYELPEFLVIPARASQKFAEWMAGVVK